MSYNDEIINHLITGFQRSGKTIITNGTHRHVLKNRYENFVGPQPKIKFHRWAGSLKSSQAFAYNIFSGITNSQFEFGMWALDNDPQHKAFIDVVIEDKNKTVKMFEVKMFELVNSGGKNKIFHKSEKYFDPSNYYWNKQIAQRFIPFIQDVISHFKDKKIYGDGIKQLCCHLLGIINEMTISNGKLIGKKVELFSLCYDQYFTPKFENDVENYKNAIQEFKVLVDKFLIDIKMDSQIKFCGYLSANYYLRNNIEVIGMNNYDYVTNRYYN